MNTTKRAVLSSLWLFPLIVACSGEAVTDGPSNSSAGAGGSAGATMQDGGTPQDAATAGSAGSSQDASTGGSGGTTLEDGGPGPHPDASADAFDCAKARETYEQVFQEAIGCDPSINAVQCSGETLVYDVCGCPVGANITRPQKVKQAQKMYENLLQAHGCVLPCGAACMGGEQWACNPESNTCTPAWQ